MRIKCNDGKVREFGIASITCCQFADYESVCKECGKGFGYHDTKILKPKWRAHKCVQKL